MPSRLKCAYREGAKRCPRDGTSNPPLCAAHRTLLEEEGRHGQSRTALGDVVERFVSGKKVSPQTLVNGIAELGALFGLRRQSPDRPPGPHQWMPPPPPDPARERVTAEDARRLAEVMRARNILGFAPSDVLTEEAIKKQHRALAKRFHPDRAGGSLAKMQTVNAAVDVLVAELG